ncbi:hypothetical protein TRFO_18986 [Tritrichomonas foetus]|uniref:Uncharacterized protein n=1 Tax=Tritrichomonas foetus TaxID=1144522 RepID=A0A1J4KKS5_9EUKA|nr:hypothetical protein TRFO_18986 [Tritrichomonas foetus]|eukprot:OHT11536.1 hypothetical protein TRFO_18986 [Tritrichomonas foetus]
MLIISPNLSKGSHFFALLLILLFAILFVYRFFRWITNDQTLMNSIISQYFDDRFENEEEEENEIDIYLRPYRKFYISVIYRCDSEICIIREQIVCLSHILSNQLHPKKQKYEFICIVPPHMHHLYEKICHLSEQLTAMRPYKVDDITDIEEFIVGGLHSKGKFIVDARYLASELDLIKQIPENKYIKCIQPENSNKTKFLPIIATKDAMSSVFRQLHTTSICSFPEFEFLCFNYNVKYDFITFPYYHIHHPMYYSICYAIIKKIVMFMYLNGYWLLPNFEN